MDEYVPFCIYEEGECIDCDMCNPSPIKQWEDKLKELKELQYEDEDENE